MKYLFFIILVLSFFFTHAQTPQSMSYQAVARDSLGNCLSSQSIHLQVSILADSATGTSLYVERHTNVTTSEAGHFQIAVGTGTPQAGGTAMALKDINWVNGIRFLKIELAPGISTNFVTVGISQLLSIPYAFYADIADTATHALTADSAVFAQNGKLTDVSGTEYLNFSGSNGSLNATIGGGKYGLITVRDTSGLERVRILSEPTQQGAGVLRLSGPNSTNYEFSCFNAVNADHPSMALYDNNSAIQVRLFVDPTSGDGIVAADVKNFFIPHPTLPKKEIWYASIEGPEAAAYERGTAELVNGEAFIPFSEHFELVINAESLTITTSPWSASSKGLAIVERSDKGFKVKELFDGKGNYKFDWEAKAVRRGYEDYQVIRDKDN